LSLKYSDSSEFDNKGHHALASVLKRNLRELIIQQDWVQAQALLQQLKEQDGFSKETHGLEYEYLIKSHHFVEAQAVSKQLLDWYADSSRFQFLTGLLYYIQKQYKKALPYFEESQNIYSSSYTQRYIGKTLTQLGQFETAEAILQTALPHTDLILADLAWLYELQQQYQRAIEFISNYLQHKPNDQRAIEQLQRLKTKQLSSDEIQQEIESLAEMDEEIPPHLMVEHYQGLIKQGEIQQAREWVQQHIEQWDSATMYQIAWDSYHFHLYDIAYQLFLKDFEVHQFQVKFLNSLEFACKKINKQQELAEFYEAWADKNKVLYGRRKKLLKPATQ